MKRLIVALLGMVCISANAVAQSVQIANLDATVLGNVADNSEFYQQSKKFDALIGIGFVLPGNSSNYYKMRVGNSINVDVGSLHSYHLTQRFAIGGTVHYSYYNYKLRDADSESEFKQLVIGEVNIEKIHKQVYRSHNLSHGVFTRLYFMPPQGRGNEGLYYIDTGIQGDFAFSRYYKIKTYTGGKSKYREPNGFNPFSASAVVRVGWNSNRSEDYNNECYSIYIRYRFTDTFNRNKLPMDVPPITVGVVILSDISW